MNPSKCCYTIFSKNGRGSVVYDLIINGGKFPYNPYPVFLGITFDEKLNFNSHYTNMRVRALKRLNILKIFSHKSWRLNHSTLIVLYRALIGSIFDYSFFTVANVSKSTLDLVQKVQNRSIRLICKVDWICPTNQLFFLSGILDLKARFLQLGSRFILKAIKHQNEFVGLLINEYIRSRPTITARNKMKTPLCQIMFVFALFLLSE